MKRIFAIVVSLVLCMAMLISPSLAGISTDDIKVSDAAEVFDILSRKNWDTVNGISQMRNNAEGALIIFPDDDDSVNMSAKYEFEDSLDLSDSHEIGIEVRTISDEASCSYTLTVFSGEDSFKSSVTSPVSETRLVFFELPESISDSVDAIQLTVSASEDKPSSCTVYKIFADEGYSYSYIDIFDVIRFSPIEGEIEMEEDSVTFVSDGANAVVQAELSTNGSNEAAALSLVMHSTNSGVITVEDTASNKTYQTSMYVGENEYTLFLNSVPDAIKISFSAGSLAEDASYKVTKMNVEATGVADYSAVGTVSSCRYDGSNVIAVGTVTPAAAVDYIDASLGLFKFEIGAGEQNREPIAKIKMSTSFELKAEIDSANAHNKYYVAVINGDDIIPVSIPMFASSYSDNLVPYSNTRAGLLGVGTADAFSYNAGLVVLDVYINDLITSDTSKSRLFPYGEKLYYFNESYIDGLTGDVRFMKSLGYNVYLRMYSATAPLNDKYDADAINKMSAALSFVANEIDGVDGYALLSDFDKSGDTLVRAQHAADTIGIFAGVVRSIRNSAEIYISATSENAVFATYATHYAKKYGVQGLSAMFACSDKSDLIPVKISADSAAYPRVTVLNGDDKAFGEFYESAKTAGMYAAVLDVSKNDDLSSFSNVASSITQKREGFEGKQINPSGTYSLWNFTDAYTTYGWIAGGGLSSPMTVEAAEKRAMRCHLDGGEEGIVLCRFSDITDISAADGVVLKLNVTGEIGASIELVLATKQTRAVFSGYVEEGEATLYADLSKFNPSEILEFAAITVDSASDVELDVYEISLYSETLTEAELSDVLSDVEDNDAGKYGILIVAVCTGFVVTMVIFILLSRKNQLAKKADRE